MANENRDFTFANTFPTGTHAMWLNYWLAANGISTRIDGANSVFHTGDSANFYSGSKLIDAGFFHNL